MATQEESSRARSIDRRLHNRELVLRLLGNESWFLLLDDPFLAADLDRLRKGFETLQALSDDGWQILYLTAKQEVTETMVNEYDLAHTRLEPISSPTR